ncbi:MAG: hypothetical protein D6772_16470, partial [Bacteroidetes bacterium]
MMSYWHQPSILKQKWYCLTLKVQARKDSVLVSIHDLPAVIASLGVGIYPKPQHEFLTLTGRKTVGRRLQARLSTMNPRTPSY